MLHLKVFALAALLAVFSSNLNAQVSSEDENLFKGDSAGVLLRTSEGVQEVNCEGIDISGNPLFSFTLFPSLRQQIKDVRGNPLSDGVYYCRCVVKSTDGKTSPDPGRITKSLGQITYISGITLYNQGKTDEAADVFKHTTKAFPNEAVFWLCLGVTQYKKLHSSEVPDNERKALAQAGIESYKKAFSLSNNCQIRDNSIGYIAVLYDEIGDAESNREWLLKRTVGACATNEIKAQTFYAIGVKYWQCAYDLSTRYANKQLLSSNPFHMRKIYFKPDKDKFDDCVTNASRYIEQALAVKPDYAEAWSYKSLLYREKQKSSANRIQQRQFEREAEKAAKIAIDLTERQREREIQKARK